MRPAIGWQVPAWQNHDCASHVVRIALLVLTILACGGCVSSGHSIDQDRLAQVKLGESSRAEVERIMGKPQACSAPDTLRGDTTLMYWHNRGWLRPPGEMLSSILGLARAPGAGMVARVWTGGSSKGEFVTIVCDRNDRVSSVSTYLWELEAGRGLFDRNQQSSLWTMRRILREDARIYEGPVGAELSAMTEIATVGDVSLNLAAGRPNLVTSSDSDEGTTEPMAQGRTCSFKIISIPGEAGLDAIETAFRGGRTIELAILDNSRETTGAQGPRGSFSIISFKRNEASEGASTVSVKAELAVFHEWVGLPLGTHTLATERSVGSIGGQPDQDVQ